MAKQGSVRIRGAPRKEPDLHLIAQVLIMYTKEVQEREEQEQQGKRVENDSTPDTQEEA